MKNITHLKSSVWLYLFLLIGLFTLIEKGVTPVIDNLWDRLHLSYPVGGVLQEAALLGAATLALWIATRATKRDVFRVAPSTPTEGVKGVAIGVGVGLLYVFLQTLVLAPEKLVLKNFVTLCASLSRSSILSLMLTQAIVAFWEELMWRGEILSVLREKYRTGYALLICSAGFGAWHLLGSTSRDAFQIALHGLMFGALFLLTDSLWAAMGLHFAHNVLNDILGGSPSYHLPESPFSLSQAPFEIQFFPLKIPTAALEFFYYSLGEPLLFVGVMLLCWKLRTRRKEMGVRPIPSYPTPTAYDQAA